MEYFKERLTEPEQTKELERKMTEIEVPLDKLTLANVVKIINKSKNAKASGADGINAELI